MFNVHIMTDRTDANGDDIIHSITASGTAIAPFTTSLNAGGDYANIIDTEGTVHYVRRMDIHAVEIMQVHR